MSDMKWSISVIFTLAICLLHYCVPCIGKELGCFICVSNKSWDDCNNNMWKQTCHEEHAEVCIKRRLIRHDNNGGVQESFVRMCGQARLCTDKTCKESGKTCQIDCCHEDFCNEAGPTLPGKATLLAVTIVALIVVCPIALL